MSKYPKRGGDCEYTMDCMWGVDGWCDRPTGNKGVAIKNKRWCYNIPGPALVRYKLFGRGECDE